MYARLFRNCSAVVLLLCCCGLAQEARGQQACSATGWQVDPSRTAIFCQFAVDAAMASGSGTFTDTFYPLVDPVTSLSSPGGWTGGQLWSASPPASLQQGSCIGLNTLKQFNGGFASPTGLSTDNGYYAFTMSYSGSTPAQTYTIYGWMRSGVFMLDPPQGAAPPSPTPTGHSPYQTQTGTLTVLCRSSVTNSPIGSLYMTYLGPSSGSVQLDKTGAYTTGNIYPGNYTVSLIGNARTSIGGFVKVNVSTPVTVPDGNNATVTFNIDDKGNLVGTTGGNAGSSGSAGMIQDALTYLFVPHQGAIDTLKADMSNFFNWGPFALIGQLSSLSTVTPTSLSPLTVPIPAWSNTTHSWSGTGTPVTIPIFSAATGTAWTFLRGLMGAFVYLTFAVGLIRHFMPRQQM